MKKAFLTGAVALAISSSFCLTGARAEEPTRVNLAWERGTIPPRFMDQYREAYLRNLESTPNIDAKTIAMVADPRVRREHNPYQQADLIKASMSSTKLPPLNPGRLVSITVPSAAGLDLVNAATGEYRISLGFPTSRNLETVSDKRQLKGYNVTSDGADRHSESMNYDFAYAGPERPSITKVVGQEKARQIESLIGSQRNSNGSVGLPVTYLAKLVSAKIDYANDMAVESTISVQVISADVAVGGAAGVVPLLHLDGRDILAAPASTKGGLVPKGWIF